LVFSTDMKLLTEFTLAEMY